MESNCSPILSVTSSWTMYYGSDHSHMDRSILVVFLATILVSPGTPRCLSMSVYLRLVPMASLVLSATCHTIIAAVLPEMHQSNHESPAQSCPACCWPAAASLLGVSEGWRGSRDIYMGRDNSLKLHAVQ